LVFYQFYIITILGIWLAHIFDMLGVIKESQENA